MQKLIVIVGPTGVGKTNISIKIAQHFNAPIINADSRQIYREIPIGTAAPTKKQTAAAKHYLVGTKTLTDYYSAATFEQEVLPLINQPYNILSGGSMMYIDAVCKGIDDIPTIEEKIRDHLKTRLQQEGLEKLVAELKEKDPQYWAIVDKNNFRRVVHALEIIEQTNQTYTSFRKRKETNRPFQIIKIGLNMPREHLYDNINRRVDAMIKEGLIDEAKKVYEHRHLNALNTVGYKELFEHFDGATTIDEAIEKIKSHTREYARKQLTWFKRDTDICWFYPSDLNYIINYISQQ